MSKNRTNCHMQERLSTLSSSTIGFWPWQRTYKADQLGSRSGGVSTNQEGGQPIG